MDLYPAGGLDSLCFEDIKVIFLPSINVPATANRSRETNATHCNYSRNKCNILVQTATDEFRSLSSPYTERTVAGQGQTGKHLLRGQGGGEHAGL